MWTYRRHWARSCSRSHPARCGSRRPAPRPGRRMTARACTFAARPMTTSTWRSSRFLAQSGELDVLLGLFMKGDRPQLHPAPAAGEQALAPEDHHEHEEQAKDEVLALCQVERLQEP